MTLESEQVFQAQSFDFYKADNMKQVQCGFKVQRGLTLIELVMVVVILGVLAAVAVPKFVNLKGDAQDAAIKGITGSAASAASINYAGCSITTNASQPNKCKVVNTCDSVKQLLTGGAWPAGYSVAVTEPSVELPAAPSSNGEIRSCTVKVSGYATPAFFDVIGAGN